MSTTTSLSSSSPAPGPDRPLRPASPSAPLLFLFLVGTLAICGLIIVLALGPTWLLVGVTLAAIAAFTAVVLYIANRLLDEGDPGVT